MAIRVLASDVRLATAEHFNMGVDDLTSPSRAKTLAEARWAGMFVSRQLTPLSFASISRTFGRADHTTSRYGVLKLKAAVDNGNEEVSSIVSMIKDAAIQKAQQRVACAIESARMLLPPELPALTEGVSP